MTESRVVAEAGASVDGSRGGLPKRGPKPVALLLYGAGLRLIESLQLRVKDLDLALGELLVRGGKVYEDRVMVLPSLANDPLTAHLARVHRQHDLDLARGLGRVTPPGAPDHKVPRTGYDRAWQWIFPASQHYVDAATGERRRHHLHETATERAVRAAVLRAEITKRAICHSCAIRSRRTC